MNLFRINIRTNSESKLIFKISKFALKYILVIRLGIKAISRRKVIRITGYIINIFELVFRDFFKSN